MRFPSTYQPQSNHISVDGSTLVNRNQAPHYLLHPPHHIRISGTSRRQSPGLVHENQQKNYTVSDMGLSWQSDKDMPHRQEMMKKIVKMIKKDDTDCLDKVSRMAKTLEFSLYKNARSFQDYKEPSTLRQRLQKIATMASSIRHKQKRLLLLKHSAKCRNDACNTPYCADMKRLWRHMEGCRDDNCKVQHCFSSRAILSHYKNCKDSQCPVCEPIRKPVSKSNTKAPPQLFNASDSGINPSPSISRGGVTPEWRKVRLQQDRLLQLYHASKCTHERWENSADARYTLMRKLWNHVTQCKNIRCTVQHCMSSRYVLSHFRKCKDQKCLICDPVRKIMREKRTPPPNMSQPIEMTEVTRKRKASEKLRIKCGEILNGLQTHQYGWVFNTPVDPIELEIPDYFDIIKKPMDLGTIKEKLDSGNYHFISDFASDIKLTFENAMIYNKEGSDVYNLAEEFMAQFLVEYKKLESDLASEDVEGKNKRRRVE